MELTRIDTIVQFTQGSNNTWNNINIPVPAGAVVIDTVNKIIKEGDGTTLFANLPICLDYDFNSSTSGAITPVGDDAGSFVISDDSTYTPSSVKLADVLSSLTTKSAKSITQQNSINTLTSANRVLAVSEGTVDGTIVICDANGKYAPGDKTITQLISDLIATANTVSAKMHIDDLIWYSDSGLTNPIVTPNEVTEQNTYWVKVSGFHDSAELRAVDFGLATTTPNVTITTTNNEETCAIIAAVYGGAGSDIVSGTSWKIDKNDNIVGVGNTTSEGLGGYEALIIKLDSNLNLLAKKRFGGTSNDYFNQVAIDNNNNYIVTGWSTSEATAGPSLTIIKFDSDLNILAKKRFGGTSDEKAFDAVVDSNNNIFICGYSSAETALYSGLILKLDTNLNILAKKIISSSGYYHEFWSIAVDSLGNVYCGDVVHQLSSPPYDIGIIKFDNNLNVLASKVYGGTGNDFIYSMSTDSDNNLYCAGLTSSQSGSYTEALIVKFDSSLNILAKKRYSGGSATIFTKVFVKGSDVYCSGNTTSEGLGNTDSIFVKFDKDLNILSKKRYGGISSDGVSAMVNSLNDLIIFGNTMSEGAGSNDILAIKIPAVVPSGSFTGTVLTGITIADITTLALNDVTALTLTALTLTSATSTQSMSDIVAMSLVNMTQSFERDVIVAARYTPATKLITAIYTSADEDRFIATTVDSLGNIIAVGSTTVSGAQTALVAKFNSNFEAIARKLYTGNYSNVFNSVITDAGNNIICVGNYTTTSGGLNEAFIVKFDSSLTSVVTHKTYGSTGDDCFNDAVLDPSGNIIVVGYTTSEGSGVKDALVIKFSPVLAIIYKKRYGGAGNEILNGVAIDAVGNAICVGWTGSEGSNVSGLILKLDTNLNIVLRKIYNSTLGTTTEFSSVTVTAANVIYCCGRVVMATGNKGLIIKFDSSINATANRVYGSVNGSTEFTGIAKDSTGNIFVVGKTNAEGAGSFDALVVKFDSTLAIKGRKTYGTVGMDADIDCVITSGDDLIISGYSVINGSTDAVVTKLPGTLPAGVYTNKYFTDLVLADSKLTLSDDNATVSNSTLSMADSTLTLTNGTMVLSNSAGAIITDKTVMNAVGNVFKVQIGDIIGVGGTLVTPTFNVVTDDGNNQVGKNITVNVTPYSLITAIYGGSKIDYFNGVAVDSTGNIYAVGRTESEYFYNANSKYQADALIVKFDSNLNILAKKRWGNIYGELFYKVAVGSDGNIYAVGSQNLDGGGSNQALIVKFDSNLNIILQRIYGLGGASISDSSYLAVAIDGSNNIYVAGKTVAEGVGSGTYLNALIVKYDSNLNILAKKLLYGAYDELFSDIAIGSDGNIYAVGSTASEGHGGADALVVKFDSSLNVLAKIFYGSPTADMFNAIIIDSNNNLYCAGSTVNGTVSKGLIVKFDSSLKLITKKVYSLLDAIILTSLAFNTSGNVVCSGAIKTNATPGNNDGLIIKFDSDLNIITAKTYGTGVNLMDIFYSVKCDTNDNIILGGLTNSDETGNKACFITKVSNKLPSGNFVNPVLTSYIFKNLANIIEDDMILSIGASSLAIVDSAMTASTPIGATTDSALTLKRDVIVS